MLDIKSNIPLKPLSNYKIGGSADYFSTANSEEDLISILKQWQEISKDFSEDKKRVFVLGEGTNILISDSGVRGLVIHNKIEHIDLNGEILTVRAGVLFRDMVSFCTENYLSGFEWAGGLPGTVGGAVRGNAGAFAGETKDNVLEVESIDIKTFSKKIRSREKLSFSYRMSIFKQPDVSEIITSVRFRITKGNKEEIMQKTKEKIDYRNQRHPLEYPNIGSIFKNTPFELVPENLQSEFRQYLKTDPFPVMPSAKLISLAGLKGQRVGEAQVSEKHPNFIVNLGNASSKDVLDLIEIVQRTIKDKYGISLDREIIYL